MSQKEHIVNLIAKQLQGSATPQETGELQQWLQSDAAYQQEYDDMAVIWQKSGPLLAEPQFNTEVAWVKLDDKIAHLTAREKKPFHSIISILFSSTAKAAAALLILAAGGYWWYHHAQWQTFTAMTQNETLTLPDQSVVVVRKGSTLKYLKHFAPDERRVELTGEAFFTVQHNEHQPFIVTTRLSEVKVLGTSFLFGTHDGVTDEVAVMTGKVNVTYKNTVEKNNQVILTKGQHLLLQRGHFYQSAITDSNFIAWRTGRLNFNNTALPQVLQDISHYYGVPIELAPSLQATANAIPVTVHFNNQPLEQVLEELKLITGLQVKKENGKTLFYRN